MEYRAISKDYFQTMKIPLLRGRTFLDTDSAGTTSMAIISKEVARRWWPSGNPIGSRVIVGRYKDKEFSEVEDPPREVVGVVGDVRQYDYLAVPPPLTVYVPAAQLFHVMDSTAWVIRAKVGSNLEPELHAVGDEGRSDGGAVVRIKLVKTQLSSCVGLPQSS